MNQLTLFDYASLDTETSAFVQEKAQNIHARLKRTAEDIIAIGQDLIEVKERLEHGQFKPWLQSEFEMSYPTAVNFMRVADRFGKNINFIHFPASVLYELAAPSMPETVVEMVENGDVPPILSAIREAKQELTQSEQASHALSGFGRTLINLDKPLTLPPLPATPIYQPAEPPASTFIPSYQPTYTPSARPQEAAEPVFPRPVVEYSPVRYIPPAQPCTPVPGHV